MRKFYLIFLPLTVFLCIAGWIFPAFFGSSFYWSILFMAGLTWVVFQLVVAAPKARFVPFFLGSLAVKLIVALGYLVALAILDPVNLATNALVFLGLYLIYTLLETVLLYRLNSGPKNG